MLNIQHVLDDFLSLAYPRLCLLCNDQVPSKEEDLCISCEFKLPKARHHEHQENAFVNRFWGRLDLEFGAAYYLFGPGSRTQDLIHQFKYKGRQRIGIRTGREFGAVIKKSPVFKGADMIVPVPLHPRKLHIRGYNQSEVFARGLSEELGIPVVTDALIRTEMTPSQTRKSRVARLENVQSAFQAPQPDKIRDKHLLLVDDVLTTGATLEACALCLKAAAPTARFSMATIAMADG